MAVSKENMVLTPLAIYSAVLRRREGEEGRSKKIKT